MVSGEIWEPLPPPPLCAVEVWELEKKSNGLACWLTPVDFPGDDFEDVSA
jgi:hypothetical protein